MTVQIEEGKFYRTRDGQKVGPMQSVTAPRRWAWRLASGAAAPRNNGRFLPLLWRDDGMFNIEPSEHPLDLVAEWTDVAATGLIPADVKAEIVDEAKRIVTGSRRGAYGTPEENFERIARFWQAYFENTGRGAVAITAQDVSPLMRLVKEARLCETPTHRDSFVDIVGYALTGAEVNGVKPLTPDDTAA